MHPARVGRIGTLTAALLLTATLQAQTGDKLVIDGSTGVMPLAAALAKAYQSSRPGVSIELGKGLGTQARIQALGDGKIDIALASHGLDIASLTRQGMGVHEVARVAVVFGVNVGVPVVSLSDQHLCDVYAGKVANWRALAGPDLDIAVRTRPDSEVDAEVVRAGVGCLKGLAFAPGVKVMPRSGDMAAELAATAGAIGMTTMTVVEQSQGRIKALSLNGVAPDAAHVRSGAYALVRQAYFVVRAPSPAVSSFLAFVRSDEGATVIAANGALPMK